MNVVHRVPQSQVVLVIAHPDDEIFVSGTLCLLADKGLRITIVCMTDGEGGSEELLHPRSGVSLGSIRRHELSLSGWVLGATDVLFLSYPDVPEPVGPKPEEWDEAAVTASLALIFRERNPDLILTHGPRGGYGHPAHKVVHQHVMKAAEQAGFNGTIFSFCGMVHRSTFSRWMDDPSDVLIAGREFLDRRAASLAYHQSQLGYFLQPYFPRTLRDYRSALLGYLFRFSVFGRKRIPIGTTSRFFNRYPCEGLVLQKAANDVRATYFLERFADDRRVKIVRQSLDASLTPARAGIRVLEQA
jgi:LmbE family N-acetylglucosaminyl deacetylase